MRILHIDFEKGFRGGQGQVMALLEGLRDRGATIRLIARRGEALARAATKAGIDVVEFAKPSVIGVHSPLLHLMVRRSIDGWKPDLIHSHSASGHTIAFRSSSDRTPIVMSRRVDFPLKRRFLDRGKFDSQRVHYIAISNAISEVLQQGGIPAERIHTVYSGTDPARVCGGDGSALRAQWLGDRPGPLIGFVGALVDHKAPERLIPMMKALRQELPGAVLVYVGDDPTGRPRLEALAKPLGDHIRFAGWRDDIADVYAALDLFIMPSRLEGLCTALIDALFAGVPAIATNGGGMGEVLDGGACGVVMPNGAITDGRELAPAVATLWRDEEQRRRYVTRGQERAQQLFSAEAMVRGNWSVYEKVLSETP